MTNLAVYDQLIVWLAGLLGVPVIKAHQGIARPSLPYVMVEPVYSAPLRQWPTAVYFEQLDQLNSSGQNQINMTPIVEMEWVFMVTCYGAGADDILRKLHAAAQLAQAQEPLWPKLSLHEAGTITRVPELIDENWETRAQLELTLRGMVDPDSSPDSSSDSFQGFIGDVLESQVPFDIKKNET